MTGQTGLINMPDARIEPDGTMRFGLSNANPYFAGWSSISILPRIEVSGRYIRIKGVPGFPDERGATFGDFKDKSFDAKFLLLKEDEFFPALSVGAQDFLGTQVFNAQYLAASKRLGPLDATLGYGRKRIDGVFGGIRYYPENMRSIAFVAEYDATNFKRDVGAALTGVDQRKKGPSYGVEYKWGWLGAQVSYQHDELGLMGYVAIPLNEKELVPKFEEPPPYTKITPRPTAKDWLDDSIHKRHMVEALAQQDFRNIRIGFSGNKLEAILTNSRISTVSRAVGRAARTILLLSPIETQEIRITYTVKDLPVATYAFFETKMLQRYFNGLMPRWEFAQFVDITYTSPAAVDEVKDKSEMLKAFEEPQAGLRVLYNDEGDIISLKSEDSLFNRIKVRPAISTFLNDPSGAFHYEIAARATYDKHLGDKLYLNMAADLTLKEDVSRVTQPSNSLLPHVRSDIADYKRAGRLKLSKTLLNRFFQPSERVYARASAGLYEEMFAGLGGQVLYLPRRAQWAADVSLDWLKQRDTGGRLGFRDYSTVTALGAVHYRLPMGLTATARAGQFLAKDKGVRFELKRRFKSGFEFGGWYSLTNGNDITSPGSPGNPYHDKGVYMLIPLNTMLTKDTQAAGSFAIGPWTRDVGQMVESPADLYTMMEKPLVHDVHERDGLVMLGDREDDYDVPGMGTSLFDRPVLRNLKTDIGETGSVLGSENAWRAVGIGLGITVISSIVDKRVDRWAEQHQENRYKKTGVKFGNALPLVGLGGSALAALDSSNPRLADTSYTALQSGIAAGLLSIGGKYLVGRSRPADGLGNSDFHPLGSGAGRASFPSERTAIMWGVVTPYAKEYELPWLYGVAAITNAARVADRRHWVSDTVGASLLGYGVGNWLWNLHRKPQKGSPTAVVGPNGVALAWETN